MARNRTVLLNGLVIGKAQDWQGVHDAILEFAERLYGNMHWNQETTGVDIRRACRASLMQSFGMDPKDRLLQPGSCGYDPRTFHVYLPTNAFWNDEIRTEQEALEKVIDFTVWRDRLASTRR